MFDVRFCVVCMKEGMDDEGTRAELSKLCKVVDTFDDTVIAEGIGAIPVRIYVLEGSIGTYAWIKTAYKCAEDPKQKYVLYPMATYEDKEKQERYFQEAG